MSENLEQFSLHDRHSEVKKDEKIQVEGLKKPDPDIGSCGPSLPPSHLAYDIIRAKKESLDLKFSALVAAKLHLELRRFTAEIADKCNTVIANVDDDDDDELVIAEIGDQGNVAMADFDDDELVTDMTDPLSVDFKTEKIPPPQFDTNSDLPTLPKGLKPEIEL